MRLEEAQDLILQAHTYFKKHEASYQSWGKVNFLQIAVRLNDRKILLSNPDKGLDQQKAEDLKIIPLKGDTYFQKILFWSWNCHVVLLTHQEYASQIKETIPPILDDQAQLLGVNVKVSKKPSDVVFKTFGRYATILEDGHSICIGKTLEDAFVASQLLEKTSKSWILGKFLGGAKSINIIEAWVMQQFYLLKYSKQSSKNI